MKKEYPRYALSMAMKNTKGKTTTASPEATTASAEATTTPAEATTTPAEATTTPAEATTTPAEATTETPWKAFYISLGERAEMHQGITNGFSTVCSVLGGVFLTYLDWRLAPGAVLIVLAILPIAASATWRSTQDKERIDAETATAELMKDAIKPFAERVGEIRGSTDSDRYQLLGQLQRRAADACLLPFPRSEKVRSVLYTLSADGKSLVHVDQSGRIQEPKPFDTGSRRWKAFSRLIQSGETLFIASIEKDSEHKSNMWAGLGEDHGTCLCVPIRVSGQNYGMLAVDAPTDNTITKSHRDLIETLAAVLGIALRDEQLERQRIATDYELGSGG